MKKLNEMVLDAGGPFLLLVIYGIPAVLAIIVITIIVITVMLIIKARKKKQSPKE